MARTSTNPFGLMQINNKIKEPKQNILSVEGWNNGLDQLVTPSRIKDTELATAINVAYTQYGTIYKAPGTIQVGNNLGNNFIQAISFFKTSGGSIVLVCFVAGIGRQYNFTTQTWSNIASSPTFNTTNDICLVPTRGALYILDGATALTKWDGTTWTTFTAILTPTSPGVSTTGTFNGPLTLSYRVSALNSVGETLATTSQTVSNAPNHLSSSVYVTFTWTASSGASSYNVYRGTPGNETLLANVASTTFIDQGQFDSTQSTLFGPLKNNTTGGPTAAFGALYNGTLFLNDVNNDSRIVFSGGGDKIDSFSAGSGGGWIDFNKHDGDTVQAIYPFQNNLYVFKDRSVSAFSFGTAGQPVLQAVNLSIGCTGFKAVVQVEEDLIFYSRFGFYSLGNQENYINLVRTAELSGIVHDGLIAGINNAATSRVALNYFNHTVVASVPTTSTTNATGIAFNRLYLAWAEWRGLAVNNMVKYVTSDNVLHIFGGDYAGNVVELFKGNSLNNTTMYFNATTKQFDMGKPFEYKRINRIYIQFGNLNTQQLKITVIQDGMKVLKTVNIKSQSSNVGWGTNLFGTKQFGLINVTGSATAPNNNSVIKQIDINKDCLNIQLVFENTSASDSFQIQSLFIDWQESEKLLPSSYKLTS